MNRTDLAIAYGSVVNSVFARVKKMGFNKRGAGLWKDFDESRIVLEFQKSQRSSAGRAVFTMNLSIYFKALLDPEFDDIEKLHGYGGHAYWRIGDLHSPKTDLWWTIDETSILNETTEAICDILIEKAIPEVMKYVTLESIAPLWRSGVSPGISDKRRLEFLAEAERLRI